VRKNGEKSDEEKGTKSQACLKGKTKDKEVWGAGGKVTAFSSETQSIKKGKTNITCTCWGGTVAGGSWEFDGKRKCYHGKSKKIEKPVVLRGEKWGGDRRGEG